MIYNKYAMPVDPRTLEKDFKSSRGTMKSIKDLLTILTNVSSAESLTTDELGFIAKTIKKLWYEINLKKGINLTDREQLYPVFKEMNRVFKGKKTIYAAYRGVRMPQYAKNGISKGEPGVEKILEGLAYGLRSWTELDYIALDWASGKMDDRADKAIGRDKVVFEINNPRVVLDCNSVLNFYIDNYYIRGMKRSDFFLDTGEYILFLEDPVVAGIEHMSDDMYLVKVID